jgi:ataxia telangiectasia mutated family protein
MKKAQQDCGICFRVLKCFQINFCQPLFRLDAEHFSEFVDICMESLVDKDAIVQYHAALAIQNLYYMYPNGDVAIFNDIWQCLVPLYPHANQKHDFAFDHLSLVLYVSACSSSSVIPHVLLAFMRTMNISGISSHEWLKLISNCVGYSRLEDMLDDHFSFLWRYWIGLEDKLQDSKTISRSVEDFASYFRSFPIHLFTHTTSPSCKRDFFLKHIHYVYPLCATVDAIVCNAVGQSLVEALELGVVGGAGPNLLLPGIHRELFQEELSLFESKAIEKMLICSDAIFAFVLMLESFCDSVMPNFEDIKHNLLALGCRLNNDCSLISLFVDQHRFTAVLCTLVSFVVEDTGGLGIASDLSNWNLSRMFNEQSILNGVLGSRYLTKAEDQLSQILNINEILVVFRTMICTRCSFQAFFLRGINLFNSFFRMRVDTSLNSLMSCVNGVWSERLLLSTWFDILRWLNLCNARSSNKQISNLLDDQSHALSKCVENLYHLREANDLESFGRNIPFLLNQVIEILSQNTGNDTNPSDLCIHLEGIIYFICNNSANGLGKYIEDAEAYPGNIAPSIDKLRSLAMDNRQNECRHGDKWSSCVEQVEVILEKLNGISSTSTVGRRVTRGRGSKGSTTRIMGVDSGYFSLMFPSLRARLSSLKQHIQKIRILTADHTNDSISNEAKRLITQIATCLFNLNTALKKISHVDDALELMIAECLGEIGALDPLWYNINPGSSLENIRAVSEITHNRGALKDLKGNFMEDMTEDLLKLLCMVLLEPSHTNIPLGSINALRIYAQSLEASHQTIKCLLSQEQVMEILARSKDTDMKEFLNPFYAHSTPTTASQLSKPHFHKEKILWNETTIRDLGWERWICEVGRHLARNIKRQPILAVCDQILLFRKDIALFLFPYLVWSLIRFAGQEDVSYTADNVQNGIRKLITCFKDVESGIPLEVRQSIIHCLNFLREADKMEFIELNIRHQRNGSLAYGLLLDLELLDVAEAAVKTQMPYSAMQYVEMWLEKESGSIRSRCHGQQEERAKRILIEAYDLCDSVDGIYGINDGESYISQLLMYNHEGSYDKALGLSDVLLQFPYGLDIHIPSIKRGMVKSLKSLGYHHLLEGYVTSFESKLGDNLNWLDESKYSLAWKSMQWKQAWNGSSDRSINTDGIRHHEMVFRCLKALAEDDSENLSRLTDTYKRQILNSIEISRRGFETTNPCNRSLLQLQCISEIEEVASYLGNSANASLRLSHQFHMANDLTELPNTALSCSLFEKWCLRHSQIFEDFDQLEDIMSLEEVLVRIGMHTQEQTVMLPQIYLSLATYARKSNRLSVALRNLRILESLSSTNSSISKSDQIMWQIEKAEVLWSQKERRSAIWTAQQVSELICNWLGKSQQLESGERLKLQWLQVKLLTTIGNWLASQRSENSQVIIQDYLMKATNLIDKQLQEQRGNVKHQGYTTTEQVSTAAGAHFALAQYMAEMYHQVNNRIKSREWLAGKRVAKARQQELVECLAMSEAKQVENRAHIHALNREVQYDHEERSKVEASVEEFLTGALESFRKGLILSPRAELAHVFRLLSLWFSNQHNVAVNLVMQNVIDSVPSYKFVPLSYQIISRIGSAINVHGIKDEVIANFQRVLSSLIIKLCEQHPHHSLVQLIALKNSADVEGKGALEFRMNAGDAKAEEAKKYLGRLMRSNQRELLESLDTLCHAYIQLALFDTRDYHKQGKKIPLSKVQVTLFPGNAKGTSGSTRMSNNGVMTTFDQCLRDRSRRSGNNHRSIMPAVMTVSISPRADKDYSNVVRVLSFESTFSITESGIHRPKIIYCYGSDGRRFKQLVKGKDDTRQDLVIEQVFESVNHFLQEDPITSKRNLRLQTYKVVPLSPIAGVLEWVENTIPWGSYLVGRTSKRLSAHERYHPKEWKHTDCRMYLKNATNKYTAYLEIEKNFTPVFHHFFLEKFPDPSMWYHRRLNFVRSVAVSSIVGYILGIGDRHSQNILIHEETAELVHIDFGVVFDQGMALFTPETVPFRLTRDLVDGMGVSGVEGVFTRCCEVTLELMRKKSASLLTILEVFVHDPLYRWTLSPLKALRIQEEGGISNPTNIINNESTNKEEENEMNQKSHNDAATRALIRVKQKLEGFEDPNGNALSIEGQVKQLIHSAQDPHNLCHLFPGWAPWL